MEIALYDAIYIEHDIYEAAEVSPESDLKSA